MLWPHDLSEAHTHVCRGQVRARLAHACSSVPKVNGRVSIKTPSRRQKCESTARRALKEKRNVIIDRCNFDQQQRATWTRIAAEHGAACCALWLSVPAKECAKRARLRTDHEGGMTGAAGEKTAFQVSAQIERTLLACETCISLSNSRHHNTCQHTNWRMFCNVVVSR